MEKIVKLISLRDQETDFNFWITKTDQERLEAIERLRFQYIKFKHLSTPRFQRVCRIINNADI